MTPQVDWSCRSRGLLGGGLRTIALPTAMSGATPGPGQFRPRRSHWRNHDGGNNDGPRRTTPTCPDRDDAAPGTARARDRDGSPSGVWPRKASHGADDSASAPVRLPAPHAQGRQHVALANRALRAGPQARPSTMHRVSRLAVLGVCEVEPAARVPQRSLVAVNREAARVLHQPRQMEQVPRHEGRVSIREVVLRPT